MILVLALTEMKLNFNWVSYFYLLISMVGAAFTSSANYQFMRHYGPGFDITKFLNLATNNPASQSLSYDLLFVSTAVFVWMAIESRRLSMKHFWIVVLGTFTIAIAFAAPFFLFLRERRLNEISGL